MVQAQKLSQLKSEWEAKGGPPCDHPNVDKEYHLGAQSGDYGCLVCGECPVDPPTR